MSDAYIIRRGGGGGEGFDPNDAVLKVVTSTNCTVLVTGTGYSKTHQQADGFPRSGDANVTTTAANTTHGLALLNAIAADSGSKVILQPGSSLRAANLYVDCGTPNSRVVVNGGEHKIWNAIQIGRIRKAFSGCR